jgi:UDP-N-acetylmuramoyl-L-alanyl-D-glutamate--2,6-diaminopimelate ligase
MANFRPKIEPVSLSELKEFGISGDIAADVFITGVTLDSSQVHAGDLFVALSGDTTHGANFAAGAIGKGASAILTDSVGKSILQDESRVPILILENLRPHLGEISAKIYGYPSKKLKVFGVTGTNGKTTTSWLLQRGLLAAGIPTALFGTAGIKIGEIEIASERTTPEAPQLQAMLALAVEQGLSAVVMEVSSIALAMNRVDGIWFESVGFTNLSQDHLDFHGSMESYFEVKQLLFTKKFSDFAAICLNSEWGQRLAAECEISKTTVGTVTYANWILHDISSALGHVDFDLITPTKNNIEVKLEFAGAFNAFNAALAIAMTSKLSMQRDLFLQGLRSAHVPGRMEPILVPGKAFGVVDYAHTPAAIKAVIETLRAQTHGKVVAVIGAGGNRDSSKRSLMGEAVSFADLIIVTDDNPRDENPSLIREAILSGIVDKSKAVEVADREEAIRYAVSNSTEADTIVILGKGHETYQETKGEQLAFSDSEVLKTTLTSGF